MSDKFDYSLFLATEEEVEKKYESNTIEEIKADVDKISKEFYSIPYHQRELDAIDRFFLFLEISRRYILRRRREEGLMSDLEIEFRDKFDDVSSRIRSHVDEALKHLNAAEKISKKEGVPFYSPISGISQQFSPSSAKKFAEIEELCEDFEELECDNFCGWEHSAICY